MRPVAETDPSTHHPLQSTGLGSAETEKQQVSQTGGRSGARVPAAGSNHVLLPLTRNCTGFARVLHPHLLRLVTDASPWKPALGKKKLSLVQWEVEGYGLQSGAYNLCQKSGFSTGPDVQPPEVGSAKPGG